MGNLLVAEVVVCGVRPFLYHCFGPESIPLEKQERTGVAGNDPEEWKKTVTTTSDGTLCFDPSYVFGCLRNGAKYTKRGKSSIQTAVCATLQVTDDRILLDRKLPTGEIPADPEQPVYMDIRSVVNPSTRGRNVRYRVAVKTGWTCRFHLLWDKTIVSRAEMEAVVIDGGRFSGFGDGRAIGFGRFEVKEFNVQDLESPREFPAAA